jgi:hypothetical protein
MRSLHNVHEMNGHWSDHDCLNVSQSVCPMINSRTDAQIWMKFGYGSYATGGLLKNRTF